MRTTALLGLLLLAGSLSGSMLAVAQEIPGAAPELTGDRLLWTAGAMTQLLESRDYPAVLAAGAVSRLVQERGESALDGLDPVLDALAESRRNPSPLSLAFLGARAMGAEQGQLRLCRREQDPEKGVLCAMEHLAPLGPAAFAREITEEGARLLGAYSTPRLDAARGAGNPSTRSMIGLDPLQAYAEQALEGVWRAREVAELRTPSGERVVEGAITRLVGLSPPATASEILERSPALARLLSTHPVMSSPGTAAPLASVVGQYHAFLGAVASMAPSGMTQPPAPGSTASPRPGGVGDGDAEWAAGTSFVYLASRSAELAGADQAVADRMRSLGTAAVDLRRATTSFPSSLVGMGRDVAVSALTGNVLGLASRVTSFFRLNPGSLGPGAAEEVEALRQAIALLRTELRGDSDRLDRRVDDLFGALDDHFSRLETLVAVGARDVSRELTSLHEGLSALGERLDRMDATLRAYLQAGFDRDYARTLLRCLEHRERYLPPWDEMEFGVFADCLADFRTRAIVDSRDALLTDQSTALDDLSVAEALSDPSSQNLAYRLALLERVAEARFEHPAQPGVRANAIEWVVAAEAYLSLLREWPTHARAVSTEDLEAIRAVGLDLHEALLRMVPHATSAERPFLPERVLADYEARLAELRSEAEILARRHSQERLLRVDPDSALSTMSDAEGRRAPLATPPAVAWAVPSEIRTAAVLGLDDVALRYRLVTEDTVVTGNRRHRFLFFGRRHDRLTFTRTSTHVELRLESLGASALFRTDGLFVLTRTEEMAGDVGSDRVRRRVDHVPDPHGRYLAHEWPAAALDPDAWVVVPLDAPLVSGLEVRIERELRRAATVGLNSVFAAVCSGEPEPRGLSGSDRASALRIRSVLTGLTASRSLLDSYLRLTVPHLLEELPALRDGLSGPEAVLDRAALCGVVARGDSPLRLVWLEAEPDRRAALLRRALEDGVNGLAGLPPALLAIDPTLERLERAIRVQRLRAAVAAG